jgi:hypothetical protein
MRAIAERILDDASRFGVVIEALTHRRHFADRTRDAARKALERLEARRELRSYHFGALKYFVLSGRRARKLRLSRRRATPRGERGLIEALGRTYFSMLPDVARTYTAAEFVERYPHLCQGGLPHGYYYLDDSDGPRLGLLIVDQHTVKRLVRKIHRAVRCRYAPALHEFRELIQGGAFVIAVATTSAAKKERLEEALIAKAPRFVPVRVEVIPELQELFFLKGKRRGHPPIRRLPHPRPVRRDARG